MDVYTLHRHRHASQFVYMSWLSSNLSVSLSHSLTVTCLICAKTIDTNRAVEFAHRIGTYFTQFDTCLCRCFRT